MVSVKLRFVLNNRPGTDGLYLVMLYIFKSGTKTPAYIGANVYIKKNQFNAEATREAQNWIKRSELSARYNAELCAIYDQAKEVVRFLSDSQRIATCTNVDIKQYIQSGDPADFILYLKSLKDRYEQKESFSKFSQIRSILTPLTKAYGDCLPIGSITVQLLRDFEKKLLQSRSASTIKTYMGTFRAAYNLYHTENEISPRLNPFDVYVINNAKGEEKGLLYPSNIQSLVDAADLTMPEIHARNVYLLLYFLQGMRVGDLITLKRSNIIETREMHTGQKLYKVEYQMSKSDKNRILPVPPIANELIEHYMSYVVDDRQKEPTGYFLPFIYVSSFSRRFPIKTDRKNLKTAIGLYNRISYVNNFLNRNFKSLCQKLGLPALTMHTSRHSLATHLYERTKDLRVVQKAMAHSSISTTERYLHDYASSNLTGDVYDDYKKAK